MPNHTNFLGCQTAKIAWKKFGKYTKETWAGCARNFSAVKCSPGNEGFEFCLLASGDCTRSQEALSEYLWCFPEISKTKKRPTCVINCGAGGGGYILRDTEFCKVSNKMTKQNSLASFIFRPRAVLLQSGLFESYFRPRRFSAIITAWDPLPNQAFTWPLCSSIDGCTASTLISALVCSKVIFVFCVQWTWPRGSRLQFSSRPTCLAASGVCPRSWDGAAMDWVRERVSEQREERYIYIYIYICELLGHAAESRVCKSPTVIIFVLQS